MLKKNVDNSGIALFIVLAVIMSVVLLGDVTLKFIASQNRFSHENTSRIQAYYAAKAGMNYALENLRLRTWTFAPNSCPNPTGCTLCRTGGGCTVNEDTFPASIQLVRIIFCPAGTLCQDTPSDCEPPTGLNFCVNSTVTYQ